LHNQEERNLRKMLYQTLNKKKIRKDPRALLLKRLVAKKINKKKKNQKKMKKKRKRRKRRVLKMSQS
jgi:hypothetical protein